MMDIESDEAMYEYVKELLPFGSVFCSSSSSSSSCENVRLTNLLNFRFNRGPADSEVASVCTLKFSMTSAVGESASMQ